MACNQKDICLSFLYVESLRKRGLLDNLTPAMKKKIMENMVDKLKDLSEDRERILTFKRNLNGFPSINFISKDYLRFVNFEETYTTPLSKSGGLLETRFDIEAKKDISELLKNEDTGSVYIPRMIDNGIIPDYADRDKAIVTMLKGEVLLQEFKAALVKHEFPAMLDYSAIEDKLEDAKIGKWGMLETIEDNLANMKIEDEEAQSLRDEAYLPVRIENKALLGSQFYKERLMEFMIDKLKEGIKTTLAQTPISDLDGVLDDLFTSEVNQELFINAINEVQHNSDALFFKLPEDIAGTSLKDAKKQIETSYRLDEEIKGVLSAAAKGSLFEVDCLVSSDARSIQLLPTGKKATAKITYLDLYISAPSKEDPALFKDYPIRPERITLKANLSTEKTSIEVKEIAEAEVNVPLNKERNVSKNKSYKIEADFPKKFDTLVYGEEKPNRRTIAIDEADQDAGGQVGNVLTFLTNNFGSKINVATGTPINGYPESSVNILKMGGGMTLESIAKSQNEFQKLYGVYAIESKFLTLLTHGMESFKDLSERVKTIFSDIKSKEKNKGENTNVDQMYDNAVKDLINMLVEKQLIDTEAALNTDIKKEAISTKIYFDAIEKSEKENRTLDFLTLARNALINTPALTKRVPKISSLQGFAGTFMATGGKDAVSSTDAGMKKEQIFASTHIVNANFNKSNPKMNVIKFTDNNRSGIRIAQALLKSFAQNRFVQETYIFLTQNYQSMYHMFTSSNANGRKLRQTLLAEVAGEYPEIDINEGELLTLMNKTTSQSSDSFADMYKKYLRLNGSTARLEKKDDTRQEMRLKIFDTTLQIFDKFLQMLPAINDMDKKAQKESRFAKGKNKGKEETPIMVPSLSSDQVFYNLTGITYKYREAYLRGEKSLDTEEGIINHLNQKAYPNNTIFSVEIDLCPEDLQDFVKPNENGMRIPYRYEISNKEENQILDVVASIGLKEQIKEQILTGANVVNFSQRVFTNGIATLNYLSALNDVIQMKKNGELTTEQKYIVENHIENNSRLIINATSDGGDRFNLKALYENIVQQDGVEIMSTKREVLDAVTKKSVIFDNKNVSLYSHYASVSRGFALDYMHKNVSLPDGATKKTHTVLNFIDPVGGSNGIQVLSRLESPKTDKNIVSLYNGGNDARLLFFGGNADKILAKFVPSAVNFDENAFTLHRELSETISEIIAMPKADADKLLHQIIAALELPRAFSIAEITLNGLKAQMATETYNSVMEGRSVPISEDEAKDMYLKKPVIDPALIPDAAEEDLSLSNDAEHQKAQAASNEEESIKELLAEIDEKMGLNLSGEIAHTIQPAPMPQ